MLFLVIQESYGNRSCMFKNSLCDSSIATISQVYVSVILIFTKKNPWAEPASELYRPSEVSQPHEYN
jgi:hypothetical protein